MSYSANQYNYATPLSSVKGLMNELSAVPDKKYFTLHDNTLDGTSVLVADDAGLWSASMSDEERYLAEPFVVTIEVETTINAVRLVSNETSRPVDFSIELFNATQSLHKVDVVGNTDADILVVLPDKFTITHYVITVTRIGAADNVARLYNVYNPMYISTGDTLKVQSAGKATYDHDQHVLQFTGSDTLHLHTIEESTKHFISSDVLSFEGNVESYGITNVIDVTKDTVYVEATDNAELVNIHTVMKEPSRRIFGKVEITYVDPMLDNDITITPISEAYNSSTSQIFDGVYEATPNLFALYDNYLSGNYLVGDESSQVGWVSGAVSGDNGIFSMPVGFSVNFFSKPIVSFGIVFDDSRNNLVKDFFVLLTTADGKVHEFGFADNNDTEVQVTANLADVVSIEVLILRVARPGVPAVVLSMPALSSILYKGYEDDSRLMSIELFEELSYEDEIEMLGGVSANEVTVRLDNSNREFFFNSGSMVANQLKRNRKIQPWLGAEITPGVIEWYNLGTFWSHKWDVPVNGLTATVVGFDTIGLLGNTPFIEHEVQIDKSLGFLIEYVLKDAKKTFSFIEYKIDESLYDVVIPYAWFDNTNHAAALRKISLCYPMHIYCDRDGRVCAVPQNLHPAYHYDKWSESTNIIDTSYSSLYTALPNSINVTVYNPVVIQDEKLVESDTPFTVDEMSECVLNFNKPYISDIIVDIECDATVSYTYEVYSWGIILYFTGEGLISHISCSGTCVDVSSSSIMSRQDATRIRLEGAVSRDVESPFIQSFELAKYLIDRFFELLKTDKFDATVTYRGDISLTINDSIELMESIAPITTYNIKRHQLSWNGSLTGSADLNT